MKLDNLKKLFKYLFQCEFCNETSRKSRPIQEGGFLFLSETEKPLECGMERPPNK